jgi:hypothetical protein
MQQSADFARVGLSSRAPSHFSDRKVSLASNKTYNNLMEYLRSSSTSKDLISRKEEIRISVISIYREKLSDL